MIADLIPTDPMAILEKTAKIGALVGVAYIALGTLGALYYRTTASDAMDTDTSGGVSKAEFETYVDNNAPSILAGAIKQMGSIVEMFLPYESV